MNVDVKLMLLGDDIDLLSMDDFFGVYLNHVYIL